MTARVAAGLGNDAKRDVRPESFRAKGRSTSDLCRPDRVMATS
jgi:hypothetical protein